MTKHRLPFKLQPTIYFGLGYSLKIDMTSSFGRVIKTARICSVYTMDQQQYQHLCTLLDDIFAKLQVIQTQLRLTNTVYPSIEQRLHELRERSLENYRQSYERQFGHVEQHNNSDDAFDEID